MRTKKSIVGIEARNKIIKGADYVANAVKATLGPFGLNALLEKGNKPTNDGYTISAELCGTLEDEFERRGALALHEASAKTNDEVGDATSSVEALTQAIIKEAIKHLPNERSVIAKKKPSEVLKMIEEAKKAVIEKLKAKVKLIESEEELINSAKVSVEDEELAKLIGSTQWKIGKDGFILAEEVNDSKSYVQVVKGIRLDNGFGTPYLITNQTEQSLELSDCNIIITNYIFHKQDILNLKPIIEALILAKKNKLVIIAKAFDQEAIQLCMESVKSGFLLAPLNAPYVYQSEIMKDLSAITGATCYDIEERDISELNIKDVGFASKVIARRFDAIITGFEDNPFFAENIQKRVEELTNKLKGSVSDYERKLLLARIAQFQGGFAILKVGSDTPFDRKYKFDKAQDAVNSVRLALQEGTVKGAGLAFKEISEEFEEENILKRPLLCIYEQIMSSAPEGYEIPEWVRDPYLTLVSALKNACSVAGQFASINAVITTEDENKRKCSHNYEDIPE